MSISGTHEFMVMHNHIHIKPLFKRLRSAMVKMSEFFSISIAIVCVVFCLFAVVVVFCCSFFFGGGGGGVMPESFRLSLLYLTM